MQQVVKELVEKWKQKKKREIFIAILYTQLLLRALMPHNLLSTKLCITINGCRGHMIPCVPWGYSHLYNITALTVRLTARRGDAMTMMIM